MKPWQTDRIPIGAACALAPTLIVIAGCRSEAPAPQRAGAEKGQSTARIEVTSRAFTDGQPIPPKYTVDGDDVSPPLSWSGLPEGTKELALICDDPDAPAGTWVHWVMYKIPADANGLPEAVAKQPRPKEPPGVVQGSNSWGPGENIGYGGPSPPSGRHRYYFKLYALDSELELEPGVDKEALLQAMEGHILGYGELMGTYER